MSTTSNDSFQPISPHQPTEPNHDRLRSFRNDQNDKSSIPSSNNCYSFPSKRSRHVLETATTDAQAATEMECAPFFVDLRSLSRGHLEHLKDVGLLPPSRDNVMLEQSEGVSGKAAKILGAETPDVASNKSNETSDEKMIVLEEISGFSLSSESDSDGDQDPYAVRLLRQQHTEYLTSALSTPLSKGFVSLDASHPWMVYWCLHSLDLLGYFDHHDDVVGGVQKSHLLKRVVSTLDHCWADIHLEFSLHDAQIDERINQLSQSYNKDTRSVTTANLPVYVSIDTSDDEVGTVRVVGGGFGGGPDQMPHCAPTYAAVLALCIVASVGQEQANSGNHHYREAANFAVSVLKKRRLQMYAFFLSLREKDNSSPDDDDRIAFRMQHDGEIDIRACYCLLVPCFLLGLLSPTENNNFLSPSISRYIASCQSHEGGFGAEPFSEAHGGYTFCAIAALRILNSVSIVDIEALQGWLARRQMEFEGGFNGRSNKLVDGCYSFWQGGAVAVMDEWCSDEKRIFHDGARVEENYEPTFDIMMLQRYILLCAQDVNGGLRDKPSKPRDFYHSCYNLSGLSVSQHPLQRWPPSVDERHMNGNSPDRNFNEIFGDHNVNVVGRTDPVLNIRVERVKAMLALFKNKGV